MRGPFTVAIDGPAAAGKGTISRAVAAHFQMAHLDTGLLYRAVGAAVLRGADAREAAQNLTPEELNQDGLRDPEVAQSASKVATIAPVREALLAFQRDFARRVGGAVLDGRDIGSVICPQAEVKIFVTASAEVRGVRRHAEQVAVGVASDLAQVTQEVRDRDARDSARSTAPLVAPVDAHQLDTSHLSISEAVQAAIDIVAAVVPAN